MGNDRGFTLLELMIAGTVALLVVAGAFRLMTDVQRASAEVAGSAERTSQARTAMEIIARDLRAAGDALDLLPGSCLGAAGFQPTPAVCPALLDAHPWRIAIARNAWVDADGDGSLHGEADTLPPLGRAFDEEPNNVVAYRFVPYTDDEPVEMKGGPGGSRMGVLGRLERVQNPFGFADQEPVVTVLLERVLLDDRMRTNPLDETKADARYDHALFMYRLATRDGELSGDLGDRATSNAGFFLSPPLRFFAAKAPADYTAAAPWVANAYTEEIVGLEPDGSAVEKLLAAGAGSLSPTDPASDLRFILDRNRVRAVRVAFKLVDERERAGWTGGLDLDGDPSNGTAGVQSFETTVELKVLGNQVGIL